MLHILGLGACQRYDALMSHRACKAPAGNRQYSDLCWCPFASRKGNHRHRPRAREANTLNSQGPRAQHNQSTPVITLASAANKRRDTLGKSSNEFDLVRNTGPSSSSCRHPTKSRNQANRLQHIASCVQKHICQRSDYHGVLVHPERGTHAGRMKQTLSKGATCLTKRTPTLPWSSASTSCINAVCNMGPSSTSCRHPARGAKHANCGKHVGAYRPTMSYTSQPTACSDTFFSTQTAKYQKTPVSILTHAGVLSLPERGIVVIILRHTNEAYLLPSSSTSFLTLLLSHRFPLQQGSFFLLLSSSCEIAKTSECCRHVEAFGLCWILVQRSAGRVQTHTCQYSDSCWGPFASRKANRRHRPQAHE